MVGWHHRLNGHEFEQTLDDSKLWASLVVQLVKTLETPLRSNQSLLKETNPEYSLEGLMLKLQYSGHLM